MLGERIRQFRNEKGLSQAQLAERLHVVRQTVSKWEKGASVPDAELLLQLARALDVPAERLLDLPPDLAGEQARAELASLRQQAERARQAGRVLILNPIPESKWPYLKSAQAFGAVCSMVSCSTTRWIHARASRRSRQPKPIYLPSLFPWDRSSTKSMAKPRFR